MKNTLFDVLKSSGEFMNFDASINQNLYNHEKNYLCFRNTHSFCFSQFL